MSFWKIAGEFAKDFAKGYVNERGVQGTLEDLGELASGAKSFFSSEGSGSDNSGSDVDVFFDTYNDLLDKQEYNSAVEFVVARYYSFFGEHDAIYYLLLAKAKYLGAEADDETTLRKALSILSKAKTDDADIQKEIKELREYIETDLHQAIALNHWSEIQPRLDDFKENNEFDKAFKILNDHYNDYEDGQLDFYYWQSKFRIYESMGFVNHNPRIIDELKKCVMEARKLASDSTKELLENLDESLKGYIIFQHFIETRDKMWELFDQHKYDEAEKLLKSHYREYEGNTFDFAYWSNMFNVIILSARDHVRPLDISGAEECIINARHMAESDDDRLRRTQEMEDALNKAKDECQREAQAATSPQSATELTESEKEYLNEIKSCLADDNEISARERRLLDKLRTSLGITESRAAELEAMANPQALTDNEKEYADEIKACLADDGTISDRERRLLDRLRKSLGISEERGAEIEQSIV